MGLLQKFLFLHQHGGEPTQHVTVAAADDFYGTHKSCRIALRTAPFMQHRLSLLFLCPKGGTDELHLKKSLASIDPTCRSAN